MITVSYFIIVNVFYITNAWGRYYYFPHYTDRKVKHREFSNLPKVTVSKWKAKIQMQAIWFQSLGLEPLNIFRQYFFLIPVWTKKCWSEKGENLFTSLGISPSFLGFSVVLIEIYSLFHNSTECDWQIPFLYLLFFLLIPKTTSVGKDKICLCVNMNC